MNEAEFLKSLTPAQKAEFETDIKALVERVGAEYSYDPSKAADVVTNMRLQNEVFFNLTLIFHIDDKGEVKGLIKEIKRFNSIDDYLDAINETQSPRQGFRNIKL